MESRIKSCENNGELAESAFAFIYSQLIDRRSTPRENKYKHIDFFLKDGRTVDVKAKTKITPNNNVCVEVINVYGSVGWCHTLSAVDLIAFETYNDFVIVQNKDLIKLLPDTIPCTIPREDRMSEKKRLNVFTGRKSSKYFETNKDVFTYIPFGLIEQIKIIL